MNRGDWSTNAGLKRLNYPCRTPNLRGQRNQAATLADNAEELKVSVFLVVGTKL
jgi:hypothetical protein